MMDCRESKALRPGLGDNEDEKNEKKKNEGKLGGVRDYICGIVGLCFPVSVLDAWYGTEMQGLGHRGIVCQNTSQGSAGQGEIQ